MDQALNLLWIGRYPPNSGRAKDTKRKKHIIPVPPKRVVNGHPLTGKGL